MRFRFPHFNTDYRLPRGLFLLGCLLCTLLWMPACAPQEQTLVISEVVSANKFSFADEALGSPDWVELHNTGTAALDLQGYILTDKDNAYGTENILPSILIPGGGYVVLPAKPDTNTDAYSLPFGLSRGGDTLCLLDPSGALLERVSIPALNQDVSYARRKDGTFGYCLTPTPGRENGPDISDTAPEEVQGPTTNALPSQAELFITEVLSSPLASGNDWVEIYNPGSADLSLDGFYLSDREDKANKAPLPPLTVPAQGYALLPCGPGEGQIHLGIDEAGEALFLFDSAFALVDALQVPALLPGQSWAKTSLGTFGCCGAPTPGSPNADATIGIDPTVTDPDQPLIISEVLPKNTHSARDGYGDYSDYVELYNRGTDSIELSDYFLSDDSHNPALWQLPQGTLAPGEYTLVFLSGNDSLPHELHAPFALSLGESLCLYRGVTRALVEVPLLEQIPDDTSVSIDQQGQLIYFAYPTPGRANAKSFLSLDQLTAAAPLSVRISEVSAAAQTGGDWVELVNGSDTAVNLLGWTLSDTEDGSVAQPLSGTLAPGAYGTYDAAFGIRATGETLFLFDEQGNLRDIFATGDLSTGITSGRQTGSLTRLYFTDPTRDAANVGAAYTGFAPTPLLPDGQLYADAPFSLSITCSLPEATVYYTLDGSQPTKESQVYTAPLTISDNTVVRALALAPGLLPSQTATATYLFETPHTLPVVTLACEPRDFAAFMRIKNIGSYPHTDAALAFYEADGTLGTAFLADINPRGNQSIKYPQKSLSIHLRARLGQGSVSYPFWGEGTALSYGTLILRNGSQDYTKARLRDSFALKAVEGLGLDSARTRPVVVYVNGVYYGIMDLNEGMNQDYLVTHYQADPAAISHVSTNSTVRFGSNEDFLRVRSFARSQDFTKDETLAAFSEWVDVDYITDYIIAQSFFCNYDIKNQSYWATADYSIRWRPVFYDIDRCFADGSSNRNLFAPGYFNKKGVVYDQTANRVANMDLFAYLRDNPAWCQRFLHRYAELLQTRFSVETLQSLLTQMANTLRPEMPRHIALYRAPSSPGDWEAYIASMEKEIALRHAAIQTQLQEEFHLTPNQWQTILNEARPAS